MAGISVPALSAMLAAPENFRSDPRPGWERLKSRSYWKREVKEGLRLAYEKHSLRPFSGSCCVHSAGDAGRRRLPPSQENSGIAPALDEEWGGWKSNNYAGQ